MIGTTLDEKYRIERLLGEGGMGAVYAAEDVRDGQVVAVKVIHAHLIGRSPDLLARFEREARAAAGVDTEHIVRCLDAGVDPASSQPYMVLELLTGEDLQRVLRRTGPVAPDLALRIIAQAGAGLARAHEADIIHRDIKPANLFLAQRKGSERERVVKILDFGVAKVRKDPSEEGTDNDGLTRTGSMLGSPLYMSPEQARSVKSVDQRADIWSLGVVLYKALAGRTPFDHIASLGDLVLALWNEPPPPVQQFAPWVSPDVASLLDRMLRIEPADRFQTMTEVLEAVSVLLPHGTDIDDEMLVPLAEGARQRTAATYFRRFDTRPRVRTEPAPGAERPSGPVARAVTAQPGSPGMDGLTSRSGSVSGLGAVSATTGGAARGSVTQNGLSTTDSGSVAATPPRKMSTGLLVAIALGGLGIGLGGAFLLLPDGGSAGGPSPSATAEQPSSTAPAITPRTTTTPAASAPATTAPPSASEAPSASVSAASSSTTSPSAPATSSTVAAPRPTPTQPKTAPPATTTKPPSTGPSFTDFGDRK